MRILTTWGLLYGKELAMAHGFKKKKSIRSPLAQDISENAMVWFGANQIIMFSLISQSGVVRLIINIIILIVKSTIIKATNMLFYHIIFAHGGIQLLAGRTLGCQSALLTRGGKNIFLSVNPVLYGEDFLPKRVIYNNI